MSRKDIEDHQLKWLIEDLNASNAFNSPLAVVRDWFKTNPAMSFPNLLFVLNKIRIENSKLVLADCWLEKSKELNEAIDLDKIIPIITEIKDFDARIKLLDRWDQINDGHMKIGHTEAQELLNFFGEDYSNFPNFSDNAQIILKSVRRNLDIKNMILSPWKIEKIRNWGMEVLSEGNPIPPSLPSADVQKPTLEDELSFYEEEKKIGRS